MKNLPSFFNVHKKWGVFVITLTPVCLACLLSFGLGYRVLINTTHSLPHTFYLTNPTQKVIKRGDYIAFTHSISKVLLVKQVKGVAGDTLIKTADFVRIDGVPTPLRLRQKRADGTSLTPLKADVISDGTVFVAGSHPDSFDSRYQEIGLIPLAQVRGQVWPLF
jgi:conjugative transfer signal peptidase TraF